MNEVRPNYTMVLAAAEYEAEWHKHGKPRKDANKTPYINHPIAVARLLADEGAVDDPEVLVLYQRRYGGEPAFLFSTRRFLLGVLPQVPGPHRLAGYVDEGAGDLVPAV